MSQAHPERNGQPVAPDQPPYARQPSPDAQIIQLNESLNRRAQELRLAQDREVWLLALVNDLETQLAAQTAMMDQMRAENVSLRKRLGLPEVGAIPEDRDEVVEPSVPEESALLNGGDHGHEH